MSLGPEIRDVLFTPVRLREAYDMSEVDTFLDALAEAADRGELLPPMVREARFATVRLREGYEKAEVDAFLARVAGTTTAAAPLRPPTTATSDRPVIQKRRGLIARLIGRGV